jgi:hypothetical protein
MDAWDYAKSLADKHQPSSQNLFVRLTSDGDKVTGVFCGAPYPRDVVWTGERYEVFDSKNPAHSADGRKPSLRVALNFYDTNEGVMRIIEGGTAWMRDVLKVKEKYGLERWSFEIERHGEAGDPKTKYTILPEAQLSDEDRAHIAQARLHDLVSVLNPKADGKERRPEGAKATPAPAAVAVGQLKLIDHATGMALVERLKALPRSCVDEFLKELGVQRIREIRKSELARAQAVLARFEQAMATLSEPEEIDPFA